MQQVDELPEPINSDDLLVIEQLAPTPRWYRHRFLLLAMLLVALVGGLLSERVIGVTRPLLSAEGGGGWTTSSPGPPARSAEMGFDVVNQGRFATELRSVELGPGVRSTVVAGQRNEAGVMTDQVELPVRIAAGAAVSLVVTAEVRDCELLDPEVTDIGVAASTTYGPVRLERLKLDFTAKRDGAPMSYSYSGEDPWSLGWPAVLFAGECPELTR